MFKAPSRILLLTAAAAGFAGTAVPAFAKADQPSTRLTIEQRGGKTVYCVSDAVIGSRVPKQICQDRADWAADGLVIPEPRAAAKSQQPASPSAGGGQGAAVPSAPKAP